MRVLLVRALAVLAVIAGLQVTSVAAPAWACGCGAAWFNVGADSGEQSVLRFDGQTETISLQLQLQGVHGTAALVLPVPAAAHVSLGDKELIPALQGLMQPETVVKHYLFTDPEGGGGFGAATSPDTGVTVVSQQHLGAFDVAQLGATNLSALDGWLADNGFKLDAGVAKGLGAYIAEGWRYVAIKLDVQAAAGGSTTADPDGSGGSDGSAGSAQELDPIQIEFATTKLVYPMRLSASAKDTQSVTLYVIAPHRMAMTQNPESGAGPQDPYFAGWITPALARETAFGGSSQMFLTVFTQQFAEPSDIDADYAFARASSDATITPAPNVIWAQEYWLGMTPTAVIAIVVLLIVLGLVVWRVGARQRRRERV